MTKYAHELTAGDFVEPRKFTISSVANQQCLFAQEDYHPRYLPDASGAPEIVHPALVIQMLANTKSPSFRVPAHIGALLAEARTEFIRPLRVDQAYVTSWQIVKCYTKRDKAYQEIKAEITDADGNPMVRRTLQLAYVERSA